MKYRRTLTSYVECASLVDGADVADVADDDVDDVATGAAEDHIATVGKT
jgi:hypothetical protein